MFSAIYIYSTTKTGKYAKELSLSFAQLKTELKTPTGRFSIAIFVQADGRKIMRSLWATLHYLSLYSRL